MKRILHMLILSVFLSGELLAQAPQELAAMLQSCPKDSCMRIEYALSAVQAGNEVSDTGYVEFQDGLWVLKGKGLEMYTDRKATWIADPVSKEVLVEPVWTIEDLESFYSAFLSKGGSMDLSVLSVSCSEKKPAGFFTPAFSSAWIITDLR